MKNNQEKILNKSNTTKNKTINNKRIRTEIKFKNEQEYNKYIQLMTDKGYKTLPRMFKEVTKQISLYEKGVSQENLNKLIYETNKVGVNVNQISRNLKR